MAIAFLSFALFVWFKDLALVKTDSTFCNESPSSTSFRSEVFCSGVKELNH
nr:hypothetical protein [Ureaplasma diversum]